MDSAQQPSPRRHFGSDNWSGVHPEVIAAISAVNSGHAPSYGHDSYTQAVAEKLRKQFGDHAAEVFFVFTGTGANVLALQTLALPFNAVICADSAHIHTSECGAIEKHAGCKLLPIPAADGKIDRDGIAGHLHSFGDDHSVQPSAVSISQSTEYGTTYTRNEIEVIAGFAHDHGLKLHMDGARLANAAAHLKESLAAISGDAGVDVLSFGGTKNGLIAAEAVVFFDPGLARDFAYRRMQGTQLASKMRFIAAQFDALFNDDLWLRSAAHANRMATRLAQGFATIAGIKLTQKVQANEVFAIIPRQAIARLQEECFFHVWSEESSEARFVTSFDSTEEDVTRFLESVSAMNAGGAAETSASARAPKS